MRLLSGSGPCAQRVTQRVRPACVTPPGPANQLAVRRQEEVLIDIDRPVRVGLRVTTSEWFRRSRRQHVWPDVSGGSVGTVTRLARAPHHAAWHPATQPHAIQPHAIQSRETAVDNLHAPADALEVASRTSQFGSMFARKTHQHHGAMLPHHIGRAQDRRARGGGRARGFDGGGRGRCISAVSIGSISAPPASGGGTAVCSLKGTAVCGGTASGGGTPVCSLNSERPWAHLYGTQSIYTTHDRQQIHTDPLDGKGQRLHALDTAVPNKAFSRKSAAYWASPHAWGHFGSLHWSHPRRHCRRRHWGFPAVAAGGTGRTSDVGGANHSGEEGGEIVAVVEWDNGSVGEYAVREHALQHVKHSMKHVNESMQRVNESMQSTSRLLCMATLALAHGGSRQGAPYLKTFGRIKGADLRLPDTARRTMGDAVGCGQERFVATAVGCGEERLVGSAQVSSLLACLAMAGPLWRCTASLYCVSLLRLSSAVTVSSICRCVHTCAILFLVLVNSCVLVPCDSESAFSIGLTG